MKIKPSDEVLNAMYGTNEIFSAENEDQAMESLSSILGQMRYEIDEVEETKDDRSNTTLPKHETKTELLICSVCGFLIDSGEWLSVDPSSESTVRKNQGCDIIAHSACICDNLDDDQ